jgi:hypothetical protein
MVRGSAGALILRQTVARPSAGKVVVAGQSLAPYEDQDRRTLIILALG